VALIKDLFHELYDAPVSHTPSSVRPAYSTEHPDLNLFQINSSADLLNDHLSLTHAFSSPEFPISEDITIGSYRTIPTGPPNGLLDGNATMEYEYFNSFTLADMAYGYQENTCGDGRTVLNDVVISNSSTHSEFHRDIMAMCREEHELFMWHSRLKHTSSSPLQMDGNNADFYVELETNNYAVIDQIGHTSNSESSHSTNFPFTRETQIKKDHALRLDESSVPDIPGGQELSPIPMNENECFIICDSTNASPTETNKTVTEECIVPNTLGTNSAEIKKRCRKAELRRPRPRDRQLIQDRMKGLRELIPNASKVWLLTSFCFKPR
jgi:hypothetical protein